MKSHFFLPLALLAPCSLAHPNLNQRQAASTTSSNATNTSSNTTTTIPTTPNPTPLSPSQFSAQALGLIAGFIPQSLLPGLGVAIQAAASSATISGDINSIVTSALIAPTPPPFLSALPSQYSPYISSLEAQLSSLRAIGQGYVPGQVLVTTQTANGTVAVKTLPGVLTQTRSNGSLFTSTLPLSGPGEVVVLTMTNTEGSTFYTGSTVTSTSTTSMPTTSTTVSLNHKGKSGGGRNGAESNLLGCSVDLESGAYEFEERGGGGDPGADCGGGGGCRVRWVACCFLNDAGICDTHPLFANTEDGSDLEVFAWIWVSCLRAAHHYTWTLS